MSKDYEIIHISQNEILVTVLTVDMTNSFWQILENDIKIRSGKDIVVIFDFLLKLGPKNRFFYTYYKGHKLEEEIKPANMNRDKEILFDLFFKGHLGLLERSLMSSRAQQNYIEYSLRLLR